VLTSKKRFTRNATARREQEEVHAHCMEGAR
jgi:hypothetical protein